MAGIYVINIGTGSAKQWVSHSTEFTLNGMSTAQVVLDGVNSTYAAQFVAGADITIYKNGSAQFVGIVVDDEIMSGGGLILTCHGIEHELVDEKAPMSGSDTVRTWTATSDHTILSTLVTSVSGWTVDVTNSTFANVDFRTSATESVWNAVIRLVTDGGKDILIDQSNKKVYLYDELTRDDKFSFVEGKNASGISRRRSRSRAGKVIVYGKGDGANQIQSSTGSGTPVHVIIDRNIVSTTQAAARASAEYAKYNPEQKSYTLNVLTDVDSLQLGDMGQIENNSAGISEEVDIVRIKRNVDSIGTEKVVVEVTNPTYRLATKNNAELIAKQTAENNQANSAMQGSGNINTWGAGINAKTSFPLKIGFHLSADQIQDEAGNFRVNTLEIDYDIDKFQQAYGTASYDGTDPQVQNSSGNTAPDVSGSSGNASPDVSGSSGNANPSVSGSSAASWQGSVVGSDTGSNVSCSSGSWTTVASISTGGSGDELTAEFYVHGDSGGAEDISIGIDNTGVITGTGNVWEIYQDGFRDNAAVRMANIGVGGDGSSDSIIVEVYPHTGAITVDAYLLVTKGTHTHGDGSYSADNHPHTDGSYTAASHPHTDGSYAAASHDHPDGSYDINAADIDNISIADDVGEAGSVNASSVNLYLDFWNGSSWVNKHSILATGKTIDTDVDISNSGTYPDATGFWRVRIEPITATADFAQGIVRLKSAIDN